MVDEETIAVSGDRRAYAQALLAFGDRPTPHAAVAPLIRPRHLARRISRITQEAPMSRRSTLVALTAVSLVSAVTVSAAMNLFPISGRSGARMVNSPPAPTSVGQKIFKQGDGVTLPRVIHEVRPVYTKEALVAKIQGDIQLSIVVRSDGAVSDVEVTQSLDPEYGLDAAAVDAARQWRFEPGQKDGKAVDVQVTLLMTFRLRP